MQQESMLHELCLELLVFFILCANFRLFPFQCYSFVTVSATVHCDTVQQVKTGYFCLCSDKSDCLTSDLTDSRNLRTVLERAYLQPL